MPVYKTVGRKRTKHTYVKSNACQLKPFEHRDARKIKFRAKGKSPGEPVGTSEGIESGSRGLSIMLI